MESHLTVFHFASILIVNQLLEGRICSLTSKYFPLRVDPLSGWVILNKGPLRVSLKKMANACIATSRCTCTSIYLNVEKNLQIANIARYSVISSNIFFFSTFSQCPPSSQSPDNDRGRSTQPAAGVAGHHAQPRIIV